MGLGRGRFGKSPHFFRDFFFETFPEVTNAVEKKRFQENILKESVRMLPSFFYGRRSTIETHLLTRGYQQSQCGPPTYSVFLLYIFIS